MFTKRQITEAVFKKLVRGQAWEWLDSDGEHISHVYNRKTGELVEVVRWYMAGRGNEYFHYTK